MVRFWSGAGLAAAACTGSRQPCIACSTVIFKFLPESPLETVVCKNSAADVGWEQVQSSPHPHCESTQIKGLRHRKARRSFEGGHWARQGVKHRAGGGVTRSLNQGKVFSCYWQRKGRHSRKKNAGKIELTPSRRYHTSLHRYEWKWLAMEWMLRPCPYSWNKYFWHF